LKTCKDPIRAISRQISGYTNSWMVKKKAVSLDFKDLKEVRSSMASAQTVFKKPTQED